MLFWQKCSCLHLRRLSCLKNQFEGQLEVLLKPLCRLFAVLLELKTILNQSVENLPGFQTSNLGNYRSACLQELKSSGWLGKPLSRLFAA